jgi:hypothetical protein
MSVLRSVFGHDRVQGAWLMKSFLFRAYCLLIFFNFFSVGGEVCVRLGFELTVLLNMQSTT